MARAVVFVVTLEQIRKAQLEFRRTPVKSGIGRHDTLGLRRVVTSYLGFGCRISIVDKAGRTKQMLLRGAEGDGG